MVCVFFNGYPSLPKILAAKLGYTELEQTP